MGHACPIALAHGAILPSRFRPSASLVVDHELLLHSATSKGGSPMRVRVVLFVVCLGLSTWSASTLFASRHSDDLCCGSTEDCNGNGKCCDPESIGRPPCSL